uniref:Ribonuclease H-like domain-containing protein n=1 Tax=Tanacetum cinerariifolium TaxID=118510 RepID=A0A6L2NY14_TANCI|nr:ribonuclease H-like domain-containing protein [Tanacetum cinerariifolium]
MESQLETTQTVSTLKLPVIVNDNSVSPVASASAGAEGPIPPKTAKQKLARKNELKAKSTLMLAIPDENLLKFYACKDAKSYDNSSSTNETVNTAHSVSAANSKDQASTASYDDDVMFSFFSNQSNALQLDNEDLEQIDTDDLEKMDLKWQVVMLTLRFKRFIKKTGRKLDLNGKETVGFDRTKVECYNCHRRGYFARECRALRNKDNRNRDAPTRNAPVDTSTTNALVHQVHQDQTLSQISAIEKTGLGYDGQMNESDLNDIHLNKSEVLNNKVDIRENDGDDNQVNDRFKKGKGYHAVPSPYTRNYMPSRADLSFVGLDNSVFKSKVSETITSVPKIKTNASKTSKDSFEKAKIVRLGAHLIEEWESDTAVLTKSGQVLVNAAKQSSHRVALSVSAARSVNTAASRPNVNNALPITYYYFKAHSPVRRHFNKKSAAKTNNFNKKVNTAKTRVKVQKYQLIPITHPLLLNHHPLYPKKQKSRRKQRKEIKVPLPSIEIPNEEGVPTTSNDPLPSGKDRMQLNELMILCTNLKKQVLDLEEAKTDQANEIASLKKIVKKLEHKRKSRTLRLKRLRKVRSARRVEFSIEASLGDQEDASKQGRMIANIDQDVEITLVSIFDPVTTAGEVVTTTGIKVTIIATTLQISKDELTLAQTLIEIKLAKPKAKGIVMQEPSERPTPTPIDSSQKSSKAKDKEKAKIIEPEKPLKRKEHIMIDEEVTRNLEAQMQAELEEEERLARQKEKEANIAYEKAEKGSEKTAEGSEKAQEVNFKRAADMLEQEHNIYLSHLNDFFCYQCTYKFCGNGAHVGYNCPAQVPSVQTLPSFPQQYHCCEDFKVTHEPYQCQPKNHDYSNEQNSCFDSNSFGFDLSQPQQYTVNHPIFNAHNDYLDYQIKLNSTLAKLTEQMTLFTSFCEMACQIVQKKQEEKPLKEEQTAKAQNWKIPVCYDDDDDEDRSNSLKDNIISGLPPCSAITPNEPVLSTEEPDNSLSMGDEHLDIISATKSDEFIKSSVENLIPIPSESEGIPEHINQATIQDERVTVQQVQGRKGQSYADNSYKGNATSYGAKRTRNVAWFKKKAMLAEAQEAGQILDEEQLAFLTDPGIPDGQTTQKTIPNTAAFQTKDLDAYDSDCDDVSNAYAVIMTNLSNYGSNVISEARNKFAFVDGSCAKSAFGTCDVLFAQYGRCNAIVLTWIMNFVSSDMYMGLVYSVNDATV